MPDSLKTSLDDDQEHLVDPPIIDLLHDEPSLQAFVVTFVPSDGVSAEPTEVAVVQKDSTEGRCLAACLSELAQLLGEGRSIERIIHGGGGAFCFHFRGGQCVHLADGHLDSRTTQRAYDMLQQMSQAAECAFTVASRSPQQAERK